MVIDDFNPKTYAQSKRGKRHMKKRDHRYGGVHGHTVTRSVSTQTRTRVEVEDKRSTIEKKMLSELGLYPFQELSQPRVSRWSRRDCSLNKRKKWGKIEDIESYVDSCGAEIVAEQESFDRTYHSNNGPRVQYEPTKSYAIKTDLPTGSELNELYAHYQNNNKDKFVQPYVQGQNAPRDRWFHTIRYTNLKRFLPHGLIHQQVATEFPNKRACCKVVFNGPQTVVAFSLFAVTSSRRLRQDVPTRFRVSYRTKDDKVWKVLKQSNFTRTRKENIEQVFTLDFLADKESLEVSELHFAALDGGDFTVRVYGSAVNTPDEEEKHRIFVGSLKTGEYDDLVLKVMNRDPQRKQRLGLKRIENFDRYWAEDITYKRKNNYLRFAVYGFTATTNKLPVYF